MLKSVVSQARPFPSLQSFGWMPNDCRLGNGLAHETMKSVDHEMASIFLFLLLVASNEAATGGGCTEGFMDLSLLVAKAATPVYTGSFTAKRASFLENHTISGYILSGKMFVSSRTRDFIRFIFILSSHFVHVALRECLPFGKYSFHKELRTKRTKLNSNGIYPLYSI